MLRKGSRGVTSSVWCVRVHRYVRTYIHTYTHTRTKPINVLFGQNEYLFLIIFVFIPCILNIKYLLLYQHMKCFGCLSVCFCWRGKWNTGCPRRNVRDFGRVFLMLNYTDITQNTFIQSWTVTEIMAIEKCGLLGCPRTVRRPWRHTRPLRMPGNEAPLANIVMQWPWRDNGSAAACVKYLETQGQIRQ